MVPEVRVGRVYDARRPGDGTRVLVDRLWPRGMTRERADLDEWCRDVAPSAELRRAYGHVPERFEEFRRRYLAELEEPGPAAALEHLRDLAARGPLTLVTASRRADLSKAQVLAEILRG